MSVRKKITPREDVPTRKRAPLESVKPLTLGDLAGRAERIACECEWCRHEAFVELAILIEKMGADAAFRDMTAHLVCSMCGWRGVEARPIWPGGEEQRDPKGKIWDRPAARSAPLPSLRECRKVLAAAPINPRAQRVDQRAALIRALRERWPELTASAALFVVQSLDQ